MSEFDEDDSDPRIREAGSSPEWVTQEPRSDPRPLPQFPEPEEFDSLRRTSTAPRPEDIRHVDLLATFYFVVAGIIAICGSVPIVHMVLGASIISGGMKGNGPPPPTSVGVLFLGMGAAMVAAFWGMAICLVVAGFCLRRRRGYVFCLVAAGIACLNQPFGVVLGVFTFIVLLRPRVKTLFGRPN